MCQTLLTLLNPYPLLLVDGGLGCGKIGKAGGGEGVETRISMLSGKILLKYKFNLK